MEQFAYLITSIANCMVHLVTSSSHLDANTIIHTGAWYSSNELMLRVVTMSAAGEAGLA